MSRTTYGPLDNFGPEDNDLGTVFILHNVDDTITIKVRSPGDRVFSEVEMSLANWTKLRAVGVQSEPSHEDWVEKEDAKQIGREALRAAGLPHSR